MGVIFFSNFCDLIINDFTHILILITLLMYSGLYAESQNPWPFLFRLKHHLLPGHKHELEEFECDRELVCENQNWIVKRSLM